MRSVLEDSFLRATLLVDETGLRGVCFDDRLFLAGEEVFPEDVADLLTAIGIDVEFMTVPEQTVMD